MNQFRSPSYVRRSIVPLAIGAIVAAGMYGASSSADTSAPVRSTDVGGAGAFVPAAHVNGVFGAGGAASGIGGAGAFIPGPSTSSIGIGGAGAFIPVSPPSVRRAADTTSGELLSKVGAAHEIFNTHNVDEVD